MSEKDNLQVIHQVYAAFGAGDVPGVLAMLTDDVHWSTPGPPKVIPYAGVKVGHAQVTEYFQEFGSAAQTTRFEPKEFLAHGDKVVVLGHYTLTVVSTGAVIDHDWVHVFTLTDGKISVFEGFEDSAAVVAAFQTQA